MYLLGLGWGWHFWPHLEIDLLWFGSILSSWLANLPIDTLLSGVELCCCGSWHSMACYMDLFLLLDICVLVCYETIKITRCSEFQFQLIVNRYSLWTKLLWEWCPVPARWLISQSKEFHVRKNAVFYKYSAFNFLVFVPSFSHSSSHYFFLAVVEDLYKRRQPLPSMDAIYFIQPTKEK